MLPLSHVTNMTVQFWVIHRLSWDESNPQSRQMVIRAFSKRLS